MSRRHHRPTPPAVAALLTMVAGVGAVGRLLGSEAGLLALVLAVVALVVLPTVFVGGDEDHADPDDTDPHPDDLDSEPDSDIDPGRAAR